jgi:serine protease AprX
VAAHTIASWSSRGTTQDGFAKPDVYAPGAHIVSELAPSSWFSSACASCVVDGQYIRASGTSFATPMISGLVADVLELHPRWTPDQVKGALLDPAVWTSSSRPEVDALKVAELAAPAPANQGLERSGLISASAGDIDWSRASWSRASWSLADWSRASWSRASWSLADWARASWSRASWSTISG